MRLERPPLPDREYFNIGEASRIAQVPVHTLRYWESSARLLRPIRRESGHRRYTRGDMETIFRVKDLIVHRKMTIAGARRVILLGRRLEKSGEGSSPAQGRPGAAAAKLLREVRDGLRELAAELER
ncbi:MAG: MerR family transcriptional regulator [Elusimicrobiota bacterium]